MRPGDADDRKVVEIQDAYRRLAVEWHEARGTPDAANELFVEHHQLYKSVRDSVEGQAAIIGLMTDRHDAVRLVAATHSLAWKREQAADVLRELETGPRLLAVSAKYTLQSFLNGTLDPDW